MSDDKSTPRETHGRIPPEDIEGYRRLRDRTKVRLAAGESDFVATQARDLIATRSVGVNRSCARFASRRSSQRPCRVLATRASYAPGPSSVNVAS